MSNLQSLESQIKAAQRRRDAAMTGEAYDAAAAELAELQKALTLAKNQQAEANRKEQERKRAVALQRFAENKGRVNPLRDALDDADRALLILIGSLEQAYGQRMALASELDNLIEWLNLEGERLEPGGRFVARPRTIFDEGLQSIQSRFNDHAAVLAKARREGRPVPAEIDIAWMAHPAITVQADGKIVSMSGKQIPVTSPA